MKKAFESAAGYFKKKGLYLQTFFLLLLLSVLILSASVLLINRLVVQNQRKNIVKLRQSQLVQVSDMVDVKMEILEKSMVQFLQSSDAVSVMVNPLGADSALRGRILNTFSGYASEYPQLNETFFYIPASGEVYSENGLVQLDGSLYEDVVKSYIEANTRSVNPDTISQTIYYYDGKIYVTMEYDVPNRIGIMFNGVDREYFLSILESSGVDDRLYVFNGQGEWLFETPSEEELQVIFSDAFLNYTGKTSGWTYYCSVQSVEFSSAMKELYRLIAPFLLILLLLCLWVTFRLTQNIYQPIGRLLEIAYGDSADERTLGDQQYRREVDYLELAYTDVMKENQSQKELLLNLSGEILEQLFRNILEGTVSGDGEIEQTLVAIGRRELCQKKCLVLEIAFRNASGVEASILENSVYQRNLKTIVYSFERSDVDKLQLFLHDTVLTLVLLFPDALPMNQINLIVDEFDHYLFDTTREMPYEISIGKGRIYNNLSQLHYSYREAMDDIKYQRLQSGAETAVPVEGKLSRENFFLEKGIQVADLAENGSRKQAMDLVSLSMTQLMEEKFEQAIAFFDLLMNPIRSRLTTYRIPTEEVASAMEAVSTLTGEESAQERKLILQTVYSRMITLLQTAGQNRKFRYVKAAQQYVMEHYAEGSLGMNEVSEAIGISAAYLSEIFSDVSLMGFSSYLNNYRVERAKEMLAESSLSTNEISVACGFNSVQNFARVFKKFAGATPGQYRDDVKRRTKE